VQNLRQLSDIHRDARTTPRHACDGAGRKSRCCLGAVAAAANAGPRGLSRSSMHFLRKALRASPCSR
jgi:hypothetical protein